MADRRIERPLPSQVPGNDSFAADLSRELNPIGPQNDASTTSKINHNKVVLAGSESRLLASLELRAEFFEPPDKKAERRTLLDGQLRELYPNPAGIPRNERNATETKRLTDAFEANYDLIAKALDDFEKSARYSRSKMSDLAMRQELMDWVNRAASKGSDNSLPRLTPQQRIDLQVAEAVGTPGAGATPALKAKVDDLTKYEDTKARVNANKPGDRIVNKNTRRTDRNRMLKDPDLQPYIAQKPGQSASTVPYAFDAIVEHGEPHHVANTYERLGQVKQICQNFRGQKPSKNQDYWNADAERKALEEAHSPNSLDAALNQERLRSLLIRQDLVGLSTLDTVQLRILRDKSKGATVHFINSVDQSKLPADTLATIKNQTHHVDKDAITKRLKTLTTECEAYVRQRKFPSKKDDPTKDDYTHWAKEAERKALNEFRGTTAEEEQARALIIKQDILGLNKDETKKLRTLRDQLNGGTR